MLLELKEGITSAAECREDETQGEAGEAGRSPVSEAHRP